MKNSLILLVFGLSIAFTGHANKDLAIPVSKKIEGFLVDFKTKSDVEEVEVQLKSLVTGKVYTSETDENGKFSFRNIPIGKSKLRLIDKDYRAAVLKVFETNAKEHLIHYTFSQTEPFKAQLKVSWLFNWGDYQGKEHYWSHMVARIILVIYGLCLLLIFFYSVIQLSLALSYVRSKKQKLEKRENKAIPKIIWSEYVLAFLVFLTIEIIIFYVKNDFKIYWTGYPIAKLTTGNDYLNPSFDLIIDDIIEPIQKQRLSEYVSKWIQDKINIILKSLVDLKNLKDKNSSIKALAYQLYENNGVLKREQVSEYLKSLGQNERKILRDLGVKFGRYHVFLYQLIKPEAVSLRTLLWKNFHQKYYNVQPPTFGLNFLDDKEHRNKNFMLLCGFEKFDNLFVRIDILERLFMLIINSPNSKENKEIKIIPEMLNLLGCSKDNFKKLLQKMNYKIFDKDDETYFKYNPVKKFKKSSIKKVSSENPFKILKNLNLS